MNVIWKAIRFIGVIAISGFGLSITASLFYALSPFGGHDLLLVEFISGFYFFLQENLPAISWDAGTWGPGVGAFLLAMVVAHRFLRAWCDKTNRHWSFASTFCLMLLLPVLFTISFIVPGVLLQWEFLRQIPWIEVR